jgi:hypothetical protein
MQAGATPSVGTGQWALNGVGGKALCGQWSDTVWMIVPEACARASSASTHGRRSTERERTAARAAIEVARGQFGWHARKDARTPAHARAHARTTTTAGHAHTNGHKNQHERDAKMAATSRGAHVPTLSQRSLHAPRTRTRTRAAFRAARTEEMARRCIDRAEQGGQLRQRHRVQKEHTLRRPNPLGSDTQRRVSTTAHTTAAGAARADGAGAGCGEHAPRCVGKDAHLPRVAHAMRCEMR